MIGFSGTLITITVNHNSSQSMTVSDSLHFLLNYECLLFCMIDLVLIYESITSSVSVVHWSTLHSWTLDCAWVIYDWNIENSWSELTLECGSLLKKFLTNTSVTFGRTEYKSPCLTVPQLFCFLSVATETCVNKPLTRNELFQLSGIMSQYNMLQ
jgi:hypothetical protein